MSHFTVLVISKEGEGPEAQLAPYHEFECTGHNDEYIVEIDQTEEVLEDIKEHKKEGTSVKDFLKDWNGLVLVEAGKEPDYEGEHKYGYFTLNEDGSLKKCVRRTNPNSKWDWYQIGGRWTGFFKGKEGVEGEVGTHSLVSTHRASNGHYDQIRKGDVDFEGMKKEAREKAEKDWDEIHAIIGEHLEGYVTWVQTTENFGRVGDDYSNFDRDGARDFYNKQPAQLALGKAKMFMMDSDQYICTREEFAKKAEDSAFQTYAYVKDGEWYSKGDMGWWAISTNEKSEYSQSFTEMLESLPDDMILTLVDCHI